jgi:hypothetical protein
VKDDATNNKTIVAPAHGHTNLLNPILRTTSQNGITWVGKDDGTITANGTTTASYSNYWLADTNKKMHLKAGTYRLTGCPSGGSYSKYRVSVKDPDESGDIASDVGNGQTFTLSTDKDVVLYLQVSTTGTVVNNLVFKPMVTTDLSATYDDFVQYSGDGELNKNVAELYEGLESTDANLADVQSQIVTSGNIESGNTATSAHTVGTYIQWKGKFYVVTSAIAVGDTLAVGTNLAAKTVGEVLTQINADLTDISTDGSIKTVIWQDNNIVENLNRNVPFTMPRDGYVIAKAGSAVNPSTTQLSLVITANNLRVAETIMHDTPYAEVSLNTPYLKKGTPINIYILLSASSWSADTKGGVDFTII